MALTSNPTPRPEIIEVYDNYTEASQPRLHWYGQEGVMDWWTHPDNLLQSTAKELTVHWEENPVPIQVGREMEYYLAHIGQVAYYHAFQRDWAPDVPGVQHSNGIQYHYYIADRFIFQVSPETLRTWNAFAANGRNIAVCIMAGHRDALNPASVEALERYLDWMTTGRGDLPLITARPQMATALSPDGHATPYQTLGTLTHDQSLVLQHRPVKGCPGPYGPIVTAWRRRQP